MWYSYDMARKKIIQVPMPEELVYALDDLSHKRDLSRSALIREAAAQYIANAEEAQKVRQYIEGYEKHPESEEDVTWAEMGAQELARLLAEDEW
jgi:metal-responsive CopG/Arc/MetJ family transcriptional regulator